MHLAPHNALTTFFLMQMKKIAENQFLIGYGAKIQKKPQLLLNDI